VALIHPERATQWFSTLGTKQDYDCHIVTACNFYLTRGCTDAWATRRLGDRRLGDKVFRRPYGRHGLDVWATAIGRLNGKRRDVWVTKMKRYA